jgi:para-nitrobenzyl esterase
MEILVTTSSYHDLFASSLWRSFFKSSALVVALFFTTFVSAQSPQVSIDSGTLQGEASSGVIAFKGIPYALPPLGELRWRAPQPVKPWTGVREAKAYAHDCLQNPFDQDMAPPVQPTSEDCLYLNVLVPTQKHAMPLPVMVWIHGGGSVIGGTTPAVYQGYAFAKHGVIFVSINYRLGRLGYFAHPALTSAHADGDLLGNYGYMDQIAALKWVQRNIGAFGGDKNNVTVFGESHGGRSMHMLLGTSLAMGLFKRIIIESGFGRMYQPPLSISMGDGKPSAEQIGLQFAESVGIDGTGEDALEKLRALSAKTVIGTVGYGMGRKNYSGPMIDGKLVPADTPDIYLSDDNQHVALMVGGNDEDTGTAAGDSLDAVYADFGPYANQARQIYSVAGVKDLAGLKAMVGRDRVELEPTRFTARVFASEGLPVYEYRFSYVANCMRSQWTGAHHASEIPYVFNTLPGEYGNKVTAEDQQVADFMIRYWTNFAKTGDPNGPGLPEWPRYSAVQDVLMNFTAQSKPVAMPDPFKARLGVVSQAASSVAAPTPR